MNVSQANGATAVTAPFPSARAWVCARVAGSSLRRVGREMGVSAPAVLDWCRGAKMPAWAGVIASLLAEKDAHAVCELTPGLPDGSPARQDVAVRPAPQSVARKPARTVRRRRKP